MRSFYRNLIMAFPSLFCVGNGSAQDRPNIILFLVDDMGLMDTSVPFIVDQNGEPQRQPLNNWYRTPNMERLAQQGIRFSTFYAQSVSSPSRASIMTGQNAARHRTTNWINAESNNRDTFGPYEWNWKGLSYADQIYPSVLKKAGYKTIHVGKAHFGCNGSEAEDPKHLGFDVNNQIIERGGVKIAVLGMITPAVPLWLPEQLWSGLRFDDMEKAAASWMNTGSTD